MSSQAAAEWDSMSEKFKVFSEEELFPRYGKRERDRQTCSGRIGLYI